MTKQEVLEDKVRDILQEKFPRTEEGTEELTRKILEATCEVYGEGVFSVDLENFPNIVVTKEESS